MAHFRTQITTSLPAEEAFAYMADFANVARWDPGVARARRLDDGPLRVGSRFEVVTSLAGIRSRFVYRLAQLDAPDRIVLEAETESLRSVDTVTIEKSGDGCRVTYDAVLLPKGLRYLADPLLHLAFQWIGARAADGLRTALGGERD
jgi:hypothetical protein